MSHKMAHYKFCDTTKLHLFSITTDRERWKRHGHHFLDGVFREQLSAFNNRPIAIRWQFRYMFQFVPLWCISDSRGLLISRPVAVCLFTVCACFRLVVKYIPFFLNFDEQTHILLQPYPHISSPTMFGLYWVIAGKATLHFLFETTSSWTEATDICDTVLFLLQYFIYRSILRRKCRIWEFNCA